MSDMQKKYFSPRLLDYIVITGSRHPNHNNHVSQTPELLRRYPLEDHKDFPLPTDVVFFCQPEGCISVGPKRMSLRETTSFVFTLTEKDSGITRFGICVNFFRPFDKQSYSSDWQKSERLNSCNLVSGDGECEKPKSPRTKSRSRTAGRVRNNTLTSLCIISHHPFFSTFRECLFVLRRLIEACHDRSCTKRIGGSKATCRDTVWGVLTGQCSDNIPSLVMHEVREIETWILRLLSAPVPVPTKTRVEVSILPKDLQPPLLFALPDHTRFTLIDFPLHLPLELLGVDTCLKVLTAVILEHKVVLQSRDYNALSMSVIAFVSMFYPLEYMFPVIPLLPTCMASAEQLLLAPTPFLIGVPASFFLYKKDFKLPDDIWLVDLDSNKIICPTTAEHLPPLPEPEATALKTHLKQIINPPPEEVVDDDDDDGGSGEVKPVLYGRDTDCLDVAVRVAMVRFFNSPNILGNFCEHTRTMRLYPRPVVAFQIYSFLKSRPIKTHFTARLARTQAVEYFGEWSLCPLNVVYLRVQTGVYDPSLIGDKPKWYAQHLQPLEFKVYDENSTLGAALSSTSEMYSDEIPTDESGSDSEGAESTSSSYSSLSDFVTDMVNSEIDGESPAFYRENQVLAVDESKVFCPPSTLHVPETPVTNSDSALSLPDSDVSSSESSSPTYSQDVPKDQHMKDNENEEAHIFRYDSGHVSMIGQSISSQPESSPDSLRKSPHPANVQVIRMNNPNSASFESTDKPPVALNPLSGNRAFSRNERGSVSSGGSSGSTRKTLRPPSDRDSEKSSGSSIISTISNELTDMAQSATTTMSELFGSNKQNVPQGNKGFHNAPPNKPPPKQFTPLGPRKALVEKSGLVKHASSNRPEIRKQPSVDTRSSSNSENQQFLKEVVKSVLEGQGVSWLKLTRIKKLMEDENYRNFIISRLNKNLDRRQPDDVSHMEDVCVNRTIFKGMLTVAKAICHGLEHTYQNHGLGGMASAFMLMEILHTHYWCREIIGANSNRSDSLTPDMASFHGSHESLASSKEGDSMQKSNVQNLSEEHGPTVIGSPVIVNGDEFENLEIPVMSDSSGHSDNSGGGSTRQVIDLNKNVGKPPPSSAPPAPARTCDIIVTDLDQSTMSARSGDMMHDMVRNKELLKSQRLDKFNSMDSEISEASTLVSTSSEKDDEHRKRSRINHHSIRSALSDSEMESSGVMRFNKRNRSPSSWSAKSSLSVGYRYTDGKLINTALLQQNTNVVKTYLFEGMLGKERSRLWDQLQFWEDLFLDAVAQERDIIGMDQRPSEMMERYRSLGDQERKRLEHDEDRLLSYMLYNLVGFMVMMNVNKTDTRRKVRRLLGKSHIGLLYSQDVNNLLDQINNLYGNDIDLRPLSSRQMQKQSFTVHWGTDNSGDMLFMEVCDDCLLLRSVTGTIHDRWWFEKLVNMTYCPKTKVLCLWRKQGDKVQLNQFYTKKCRELYFCVKESMEKAASRNAGKLPGPELGGEFPVQDLKTGQGGLLQVCMEGIGLLLANSKLFIELTRIRKCFTMKGGIFVLEEYDPKNKQIVQHKYKSSMNNEAALMLHRIITVRWAKLGNMRKKIDENGNS